MTHVPAGKYLFVHYGYSSDHQPQLCLLADGGEQFVFFEPREQTLTLHFDTSQRYCSGWHDLVTTESFPCLDRAELPIQYNQCRHCQQKTGFNPAFYNASSVSPQQQVRNQQPHLLYLAHFAPGVVKVGISWAERGIRRLLDQGARSALIIKVYPTANIARQYEARSAALSGIAETVQVRNKQQYLKRPYDAAAGAQELRTVRDRLINEISITPEDNDPIYLDDYYLDRNPLHSQNLIDITNSNSISGSCMGMIGSMLIMEQGSLQYTLPLSKLTGYRCVLDYDVVANEAAPQQASLF